MTSHSNWPILAQNAEEKPIPWRISDKKYPKVFTNIYNLPMIYKSFILSYWRVTYNYCYLETCSCILCSAFEGLHTMLLSGNLFVHSLFSLLTTLTKHTSLLLVFLVAWSFEEHKILKNKTMFHHFPLQGTGDYWYSLHLSIQSILAYLVMSNGERLIVYITMWSLALLLWGHNLSSCSPFVGFIEPTRFFETAWLQPTDTPSIRKRLAAKVA